MKKKIFVIALAACLLILSVAGTSVAYFTDTEQYTNTFTAGNVNIELSEAKVIADTNGDLVADGTNRIVVNGAVGITNDYGTIFPGQSIYKDPTIENIGSEAAYIGAIIKITNDDAEADITDQLDEISDVTSFITDLSTTNATVKYKIDSTDGVITIYMVFTDAIANGASYKLFEGIKIPTTWNNAEMADCVGLNIVVNAYATQTKGFTSGAENAIQTAFGTATGDAWAGYGSAATLNTTP